MKRNSQRSLLTNMSGFTLIEVVLAVAIASIGIIAILGLLPNAIQSSRDAADNTLSATIAQDIFSDMRTQPFNSVDIGKGSHNLNLFSGSDTLNFDGNGFRMPPPTYYEVTIKYQPQPPLKISQVQATVVWPAFAANPANTNTFTTVVAWYDQP